MLAVSERATGALDRHPPPSFCALDPVLNREEVRTLLWMLGDMLRELKEIRRLLEDGEGEENGFRE